MSEHIMMKLERAKKKEDAKKETLNAKQKERVPVKMSKKQISQKTTRHKKRKSHIRESTS